MHPDIAKILLDEQTIQAKVRELAARLSEDYKGKSPVLICILKGAFMFTADLMRQMTIPARVDFMAISSYGNRARSSGVVQILKDLDSSIEGEHVVVVEDIIDSGLTLNYLRENLLSRRPASLRTCVLLDKPSRREVPYTPDYVGFQVPDEFVVGYGLDYAGLYRHLPYIGVLKPEVYQKHA
ncbi:MAG: hypoxanthine phosphoribosyltransferase [Bacillota bacterium]|nr:hypoxanthine phosphoribosyltransferase [Bacillota bacterium]REJ36802.1 MAG: hypoxanthine phosphoribosyltransferase [Bacillota bacterium]